MTFKTLPAAVLGLALALTACTGTVGASSQPSPSVSASADAALDTPEVDRDPQGDLPTITFSADGVPTMAPVASDPPAVITVKTLDAGDGAVVADGDFVTVNYAGFLWSDGSQFDSSYDTGSPTGFLLNEVVDGWRYGLVGTRVGDRVQLVVPPEFGYDDQESEAIPAGSTLVFVVDVLDTMTVTTDALASAVPTGAALPAGLTISGELGQEPTLSFAADSPQPSEEQTIVLAEGTGPVVTETDTLLYHIVGGTWGGETSSSWPSSYQQIGSGGGPETVGKQVGSRLLLVYPGDEETATAAQVLVLDLVDAVPTES